MKIAISGKGGVGKTTIAGTVCRLLGRKGYHVLAIDGDSNPNLSVTLGLADAVPPALSTDVLERVEENGTRRVQLGTSVEDVITRYGVDAPDNVTLLMVGKPEHAGTGCMCGSHTVVREVVHAAVTTSERVTVLDMEASLEHLKRGTVKYVDALYIVVEPYYRSLEAAHRIQTLATELGITQIAALANKVRNEEDEQAIQAYCDRVGLDVGAVIPYDEHFVAAERAGRTVLDDGTDGEALRRISAWVDGLDLPARQ